MTTATQRMEVKANGRRRRRNRHIWKMYERLDRFTRLLAGRLLELVDRHRGNVILLGLQATKLLRDVPMDLADVALGTLEEFWDVELESSVDAFWGTYRYGFWLQRARPPQLAMESIEEQGTPDLAWLNLYQKILDGTIVRPEADELVRQHEFPPPTEAEVRQIINTKGPDGKTVTERIVTVEARRLPELRQVLIDSVNQENPLEWLTPRLRELVGNDPGGPTGMNYRARRIIRTEGTRISEAGWR
ncbi:MAG: hypothetical protein GY778_29215, partial [bacterium]|nr:hypothetical protein [bacterium]